MLHSFHEGMIDVATIIIFKVSVRLNRLFTRIYKRMVTSQRRAKVEFVPGNPDLPYY